ncbi:MAG: cytochrome c3 family protein [Desulforhopalus sp.]
MTNLKTTDIIIFQVVLILLAVLPAVSMDAEDAPENVTIDYLQELYSAVSFDHRLHTDMYDCRSCHHHTTGTGTENPTCKKCHAASTGSDDVSCSGCHERKKTSPPKAGNRKTAAVYHFDKPGLKGALHLQCLSCHRVDNGPTDCAGCHELTPAGRKRFAIKN